MRKGTITTWVNYYIYIFGFEFCTKLQIRQSAGEGRKIRWESLLSELTGLAI